jgi:hypothetical protein
MIIIKSSKSEMLFLIFKFKSALILILFVKKTSQSILIRNNLETCHEYLDCMSCLKFSLEIITKDCGAMENALQIKYVMILY